jgi:hypothetical protein
VFDLLPEEVFESILTLLDPPSLLRIFFLLLLLFPGGEGAQESTEKVKDVNRKQIRKQGGKEGGGMELARASDYVNCSL